MHAAASGAEPPSARVWCKKISLCQLSPASTSESRGRPRVCRTARSVFLARCEEIDLVQIESGLFCSRRICKTANPQGDRVSPNDGDSGSDGLPPRASIELEAYRRGSVRAHVRKWQAHPPWRNSRLCLIGTACGRRDTLNESMYGTTGLSSRLPEASTAHSAAT